MTAGCNDILSFALLENCCSDQARGRPVIVTATLGVGGAILTESALSFLGLGIQLPTPSWGNMLRTSQATLTTEPWLALSPGVFIFLTILRINYIGDGLRDALDPSSLRGAVRVRPTLR